MRPVFPWLCTAISLARSLILEKGCGKGFSVLYGNVELGCQINSEVFCIIDESNLRLKHVSLKLIPFPR